MNNTSIDVGAYLERIEYKEAVNPTIETLHRLIEAHVTHIPFENIDVMLGRDISLDLPDLQDKIIYRSRGGYCFEINTLFAALLTEIGFEISLHGGRVYFGRQNDKERPRTHMVLIVHLNNKKWLVDATFGTLGLRKAIELESKSTTTESNLRIELSNDRYRLQSRLWKQWHDLYVFDEYPMACIDYEVANFYTSNYPKSAFRNNLVAMLAGPKDKPSMMIRNRECVQSDGDTRHTSSIQSITELHSLLTEQIGIEVDKDELEFFNRLDTA